MATKNINWGHRSLAFSKKSKKIGGEKGSSSKLSTTPLLTPISPSTPIPKANDVESIPFHGLREMATILGDDSTPNVQPPPTTHVDVSSWEDLDVLLKRFPTFIDMEPPTSHMNELSPVLERTLMDMIVDS